MAGDLTTTLRVLTHELRTPVGVIQGYVRMLSEGRVGDDDQQQVFKQIREATSRVAALGDQVDELIRWLPAEPSLPESEMTLSALLADSVALAKFGSRTLIEDVHHASIRTSDARAIVRTCATLIDAVARESLDIVRIGTRPAGDGLAHDLLLSADPAVTGLADVAGPEDGASSPLSLDRGGLGMALVCGAAVVDAHGGVLWQLTGHRAFVGLRLPGA
jgi:signal transduction histidine kinase